MVVNTSYLEQFERKHGRKPRSSGLWLFSLWRDGFCREEWFMGSYADAEKHALKVACRLGYNEAIAEG